MNNSKRFLRTAIVYCRVSSQERKKSYSLEEQEKLAMDFASQNGYRILKVFLEKDQSGKDFERPEFLAMLKYLEVHEWQVKFLILTDLDRLSCDLSGLKRIRRFLRLSGVKVISVLRSMLK
ncbi:MAG: recombinase family protein [Patescibacteria group bacterium]